MDAAELQEWFDDYLVNNDKVVFEGSEENETKVILDKAVLKMPEEKFNRFLNWMKDFWVEKSKGRL